MHCQVNSVAPEIIAKPETMGFLKIAGAAGAGLLACIRLMVEAKRGGNP